MRRTVCVAALLAACGAHASVAPPPSHSGPSEARIADVSVITRARATEGLAAIGLFVRASEGPLPLRTAAALVIEQRTGQSVHARATPDGVALLASTRVADLEATLLTLAHALATRDATEAEVAAAIERMRRRRAGRASDERALVARLATQALVGRSLDALGTASDDSSITSAAVSAWLASALGAERALVVVVGDVGDGEVHAAVERAFHGVPHVAAATPTTTGDDHAAVVVGGERALVALAASASSVADATRIASWVPLLVPSARASAFPLAEGAVVSCTMEGAEPELAILAAAITSARALEEDPHALPPIDAASEVLGIGDDWLARASSPTEPSAGFGIALVRAGEHGDVERAPDIAVSATTAAPTSDTLTNGLHVRVARSSGDEAAVSIAWRAGAVLDPAREHGRAALLTAVLARSCEPDADEAWVDAETIGLVVRGTTATLERTVLRAIECARRASSEVAHTEGVRAEALADRSEADRVRAWAAGVLAPASPGLVAPRGSIAGIAAASALDEALADAIDARRAVLAIVADVAPSRALAIGSALGATLASGTTPLSLPVAGEAGPIEAFLTDADLASPRAVIALRTDSGASSDGARRLARSLASALMTSGLTIHSHEGQAALGSSFAIVEVSARSDVLDTLPMITASALAHLALGDTDADSARAGSLALAAPSALARALAIGDDAPVAAAADVARALVASPPHVVIVRPTSGPLRRR